MDKTPIPFIDLKKQFETLRPQMEKAILKVVSGAQYINGPEVAQLEKALADYVGVAEVIACANGTDALTLPLLAWGVGPGEAVFCPSFTFIATAEVVALRGAVPIFVDIEPITFNMSSVDLERKIALVKKSGLLRPRAVIPVDLFGLPADFPAINAIARKHDLLVLEDAAQGFGGEIQGRRAGGFSQVGATSFFPAKPLGCYGDGGAILTSDKALAEILRSLRSHGQGRSKYEHARLGVNSRLDTLQAAILLEKLAVFPQELQARQRVAETYGRLLSEGGQALKLPQAPVIPLVPSGFSSAWAQYTLRVPVGVRDFLLNYLKGEGVPANVYYPLGLREQPAFAYLKADLDDDPEWACPETEKAAGEVLSLPMHPYLDAATQGRISSLVLKGLELGAKNV
ncbi:MAG: DegT/DnrJ/EryC1/StrS family aminotransferase [Deltaproteobacteria bacterium]|jgi:dTDP-4-amino-4,6-dideoxygalactose transaminase|nr:DegT/DnrJ/EryC1/StrS family aminotransferase [Deltaproteobacteria bacterium]